MVFSNYAAFRTHVQKLLDGDDVSQSDLSTQTLDNLIAAGELRVYRDLRSSTQDTAFTATVSSNAVSLPTDFLEFKGSPYIAGNRPAIYAPWEAFQDVAQTRSTVAKTPVYYTFQGDTAIFYPAQADGVSISGRYFKRFTDISGGLNALFNRHPDVFVYAALSESALFLGESSRLQAWEQKYMMLVASANEQERRRTSRGSKLQTRLA